MEKFCVSYKANHILSITDCYVFINHIQSRQIAERSEHSHTSTIKRKFFRVTQNIGRVYL